ncbi:hypothetical protein QJQ45_025210, partial [Haematococcus lacustris]
GLGRAPPSRIVIEYDPADVDRFIAVADLLEDTFPAIIVEGNEEAALYNQAAALFQPLRCHNRNANVEKLRSCRQMVVRNLLQAHSQPSGTARQQSSSHTPPDPPHGDASSSKLFLNQMCREEEGQEVSPFLAALLSGRGYTSPHSGPALAVACGLAAPHDHLAYSLVVPGASEAGVERVRAVLKRRISTSWSLEAVKQGVVHAKAGAHEGVTGGRTGGRVALLLLALLVAGRWQEAHRCYDKALELQPDNADAHVARGAALAMESQLASAAHSFRLALAIDPDSRNAAAYLEQGALQPGSWSVLTPLPSSTAPPLLPLPCTGGAYTLASSTAESSHVEHQRCTGVQVDQQRCKPLPFQMQRKAEQEGLDLSHPTPHHPAPETATAAGGTQPAADSSEPAPPTSPRRTGSQAGPSGGPLAASDPWVWRAWGAAGQACKEGRGGGVEARAAPGVPSEGQELDTAQRGRAASPASSGSKGDGHSSLSEGEAELQDLGQADMSSAVKEALAMVLAARRKSSGRKKDKSKKEKHGKKKKRKK